ncbi:hypothetical protein [Candidatus Methanodesulfokora washburnensis]|uniref:Uncharacterized protein n=1 Tax=Candidatus Methanodesulfokora washburnensis TaxID=2478471 RepID=A0A3R9QJU8_9CREN|nr:hypothetical protein [Candidatus Methanodesulfokores washburnensis]RSN78284.1 hypothetical protein D6D85_01355 [Candidatus Methanodesulfokores washburnensis]
MPELESLAVKPKLSDLIIDTDKDWRGYLIKNLKSLVLQSLTADPALVAGEIWFRSDLGQLRYTPDGLTVYVIDPAPVVDKTWSDTTGHYFNYDPSYQAWSALPAIQLNSPATGHKRSFEDAQTGYCYVHGWLVKQKASLSSRLDIVAKVGAYRSIVATGANLCFVIADPATIDVKARNDSVPWVFMRWDMSTLGYPNGAYGRPLSGYIIFTSPPSYSFSPANPSSLNYNLITQIPNSRRHILYGYADAWPGDWDQWASLQSGVSNTNLRFRVSTPEPEVEVIEDITQYLPVDRAVIARWDGEVRLWIEKKYTGMIVSLGKDVEIVSIDKPNRSISINLFDRMLLSGKEPEKNHRVLDIKVRTDRSDLHRKSSLWRIAIMVRDREYVDVALGDSSWDGDKFGYYISSI